jgi:hypothetical protein
LCYPEGVFKKQLETGTITAIALSVVVGFVLGYIARESFQGQAYKTQESQVEPLLQANDNPDISVINPLIVGDVELPVVVFDPPGLWVDQEDLKQELIEKEVQPRHDYYNVFNEDVNNDMNGGSAFVTAVFTKEGDGSIDLDNYFSDGNVDQTSAFVDRTWIPSCYVSCNLSEEFLEKYPEAK